MAIPPVPELIQEFLSEYVPSPAGKEHLAHYAAERKRTRDAFTSICASDDAGRDVTDAVLTQLLPHVGSAFNRERGAWCSIWQVVTRDLKAWFEGSGWVESPSAWPRIAKKILTLLRAMDMGPDQNALAAFAQSEESHGIRAGFLSPAMHCLRPDLYFVVNSKSLKCGNHCLRWFNVAGEIDVDLEHFIETNRLLRDVLQRLKPLGMPDADHFDMWCHWLVASRLGGYLRSESSNRQLPPPDGAGGGGGAVEDDEAPIDIGDDIPAWIVRRLPSKGSLRELKPGAQMQWGTTNRRARGWVRAHADVGDLVFFYEASPSREIVGVGKIVSPPREKDQQTQFDVECIAAPLPQPLSLAEIKRDPALADLTRVMVGASTGSVLAVPSSAFPALVKLVTKKNHALNDKLGAATRVAAAAATPPPPPPADTAMRGPRLRALASWVEQWRREAGYPNDEARRDAQQRGEWAELLARENIDAFDVDEFRPIYYTGAWGATGAQANLNTFFRDASEDDITRFRNALRVVLHGDGDIIERLDRAFDRDGDIAISGLGESVLMKCLAVMHPERFVGVYRYEGSKGKAAMMRLLGLPELSPSLSRAALAVQSNDLVRERLAPYFHETADVPATHAMRLFLYWLLERAEALSVERATPEDLFVERTGLAVSTYRRLVELLEHRRQIVLYGPPGTGKTHVAEALATAFGAKVERVQFHPAYGYEDFIEGLRPVVDAEGHLRYEHRAGILKALAERARAAPGERFVLIIDEINRASMARVFGELLYLLEYRGRYVKLASSGEPFDLPTNLYLIGTMNTADRSIAQIDLALRRRFDFHRLDPDVALLERQLSSFDVDPIARRWVVDGLRLINERIQEDRGIDFTIGHTYFLDEDLDNSRVERILAHSIRPLLEDLYADTPLSVKPLVEAFTQVRPTTVQE